MGVSECKMSADELFKLSMVTDANLFSIKNLLDLAPRDLKIRPHKRNASNPCAVT